MSNYKMSEYISDFLDFLSETEELHRISKANLDEANNNLCDLEHALELLSLSAPNQARIVSMIKKNRKARRAAKDDMFTAAIIVEWCANNKEAINSLTELLGAVRKEEKYLERRTYAVRTDILKEITKDTHLVNRSGDDSLS